MAEQTDNADAHLRAQSYIPPEHGWTCFHCGAHFPGNFGGQRAARDHFGRAVDAIPGCIMRMQPGERPLLRHIRWLEQEIAERDAELARFRAEDSDKDREIYALIANHRVALRDEEEKGYARGVSDARHSIVPESFTNN